MGGSGFSHIDSLRELSSILSTLGFEVIADVETESQDGKSIDGYVIDPSGFEIQILTKEDCPWFEFSHEFDIRGMFIQMDRLEEINQNHEYESKERLRQAIESDRIFNLEDVTHEEFLSRARPVWDSLEDPDGLEYSIIGRLSADTNDFNIYRDDDLVFGFKLLRRLFYNDNCSPQSVDDEIQKTLNFATPPRRLLTDAYGVFDESSREAEFSSSGLEPDQDPTFM